MTITDRTVQSGSRDEGAVRPSPGARAALAAVRAYQAARAGRPSPCRYWPSCSAYAAEAVERHGAWRGGRLAVRRLLRCHPFGGHGIDLVPEGRRRERS